MIDVQKYNWLKPAVATILAVTFVILANNLAFNLAGAEMPDSQFIAENVR